MRGRQPYEWAGMPSSTSPDLVVARLDALLGRFALSGPPSSLAHAASRVLEASSDTREPVLVDVLRTLGLRVTPVRTSAKALTASAIHGVLFTVAGGEGLLVEPMGGRARVVPLEAEGVAHLDATALAKRLGASAVDAEVTVHALGAEAELDAMEEEHGHDPVRRTFALLAAERSDVATVLVYALAVGLMALVTPITAQALVTTVAFGTLVQPIVLLGIVVLVCLGASTVMRALSLRVVEYTQRRIFVRVVADLARRLPRAHATVLEGGDATELVNRFFDVFALQKSLASLLVGGVETALTLAFGLVLLAVYAPVLLGFDIVLLAGIAIVIFVLGRGGIERAIDESKAKYAVAAWLEEIARHPTAFKADGGAEYARAKADDLARVYLDARESHFRITYGQSVGALVLQALAVATLLGVGGYLVTIGTLSLGQLVAAEIVVAMVASALVKLGKHIEDFYDLVASVDKLSHLVDVALERDDGEPIPHAGGPLAIELAGVPLIETACEGLRVRPGERVALLTHDPEGVDGSDELADLLFGATNVAAGVLRIGGTDARDLDLASLRARVSLVRRAETFPGSVRDNITLGRRRGAMDARAALDCVGLTEEFERHGHGLGTLIDFGGRPLGPSEALRLTIARAMYGGPGVVVIDGALDRLAEPARVATMDALFAEARTTTFLVVTSDRAIAARCDRTVALGSAFANEERIDG